MSCRRLVHIVTWYWGKRENKRKRENKQNLISIPIGKHIHNGVCPNLRDKLSKKTHRFTVFSQPLTVGNAIVRLKNTVYQTLSCNLFTAFDLQLQFLPIAKVALVVLKHVWFSLTLFNLTKKETEPLCAVHEVMASCHVQGFYVTHCSRYTKGIPCCKFTMG